MIVRFAYFRLLLMITGCCFCSFSLAQAAKEPFFVKGQIENRQKDTIEMYISDIFYQKPFLVAVNKEGRFQKEFFINGPSVFFIANGQSLITRLFVNPYDSIELKIDGKNSKIIALHSANPERQKAFMFQEKYFDEFSFEKKRPFLERNYQLGDSLRRMMNNAWNRTVEGEKVIVKDTNGFHRTTEELKRQIVHNYDSLYQQQLGYVLKHYNWGKDVQVLIDDIYFSLLSNKWGRLSHDTAFENRAMKGPDERSMVPVARKLVPAPDYYKTITENMVRRSEAYRNFLFDYVRMGRELYDSIAKKFVGLQYSRLASNFATREYILGLDLLEKYPGVKDWYLAASVKFAFNHYNITESEKLYNDYIKRTGNNDFKADLISFYNQFRKFKPGNPAPDFTLKDEKGQVVSLKDFKGKVVYIDFWGVHCAPCIGEIIETVPVLHEKYRNKDVVFINICVDESEDVWRKKIKELKLTGINLKALSPDAVTDLYAISAIPHHILIDKKGDFINYNAEMPYNLTGSIENEIDRALRE